MSSEHGWFADIDDPEDAQDGERFPWRPYLALDGMCLPLDIRFGSKADCDQFIVEEIVANSRRLPDPA